MSVTVICGETVKFFLGTYKCVFSPFSFRKTLRSRQVRSHRVKVNLKLAFSRGAVWKSTWGQGTNPEFTDEPGNLQ